MRSDAHVTEEREKAVLGSSSVTEVKRDAHKAFSPHFRLCRSCGRPIAVGSVRCPHYGDAQVQTYFKELKEREIRDTDAPVIAGILIIAGGLAELGLALKLLLAASGLLVTTLSYLFVLLGAVSIIGGMSAIGRKSYDIAVAGGICSCFGFFVFGLVGLVLLLRSREEFVGNRPNPGPVI